MARPAEIDNQGSRLVILASVSLVIAGLYFGREVLIPLALAILLAFLLSPPVRWLEKLRTPRTPATLVVVCIAMALMVGTGYLVGMQFTSVIKQLPSYQGELQKKIASLKSHGGFFRKAEQEIHNLNQAATMPTQPVATAGQANTPTPGANPPALVENNVLLGGSAPLAGNAAQPPTTQPADQTPVPVRIVTDQTAPQWVLQYAETVLSPLATAGLVFVLLIFILLTSDDLRDRMIRLFGHGRLNLTTQAMDEAGTRISRYLGALAVVNTAYGICVAIGLSAIGHFFGHGTAFPNVLVWGLLVGLFRFIPYLGIWIGAAIPILLSFALFPGSTVFLAVLAMFIALEVVVGQFIEPYWYGSSTGMSALAVFVAAMFWTWLWGPIGLLLSTPLTVCLVVMGKYVPQLQFLDIILGDEPVLPPHIKIYQRLVAGDEEEAADLAREMLEKQSVESVYDEVLVPALAIAEQDHHRDRLDPQKLAFVHQNLREVVEELGEEARVRLAKETAAKTKGEATEEKSDPAPIVTRPPLARDCSIKVLCLPAKSESDEIVAIMLAQLLELRGFHASAGSTESLASEMVDLIETQKTDIVCISAMPPSAVAKSRYLCKRIHARFPEVGILVGIWVSKADPNRITRRVACSERVLLATTLAQAQEQIDQMVHPILARAQAAEPATVA
jgi:predicted PurR-regulated permease PerM